MGFFSKIAEGLKKSKEILGFKINHSFLNEKEFEKVWL